MPKQKGSYHVGRRGSYGCSGFAAVSAEGTVMGCHKSRGAAMNQVRAVYASEASKADMLIEKAVVAPGDFVMYSDGEDEIKVGRVQVVLPAGIFGLEDSEYAMTGTDADPLALVRNYEKTDKAWEEEDSLVVRASSELTKIDALAVEVDVVVDMPSTSGSLFSDLRPRI